MDIRDFRDVYVDEATDLLGKLDLNDPGKSVVKTNDSVTAMLENFIKAQSATTSSLIEFKFKFKFIFHQLYITINNVNCPVSSC